MVRLSCPASGNNKACGFSSRSSTRSSNVTHRSKADRHVGGILGLRYHYYHDQDERYRIAKIYDKKEMYVYYRNPRSESCGSSKSCSSSASSAAYVCDRQAQTKPSHDHANCRSVGWRSWPTGQKGGQILVAKLGNHAGLGQRHRLCLRLSSSLFVLFVLLSIFSSVHALLMSLASTKTCTFENAISTVPVRSITKALQ